MPSQSEDSLPLLGKKWSNLAEKDGSEGFLSFYFYFIFIFFSEILLKKIPPFFVF